MDGLGQRLREERQRRGLSVRGLARRLDVSPSLISQVETGKAQPSVATLYAIVTELGISLDPLFGNGAQGAAVLAREGERPSISMRSGVHWEELLTDAEHDVELLHTTYEPGGASSEDGVLLRHDGREVGLVTSGTLIVTLGFTDHRLEAGDSIAFESSTPHRFVNPGPEATHGVWLVLGRHPTAAAP